MRITFYVIRKDRLYAEWHNPTERWVFVSRDIQEGSFIKHKSDAENISQAMGGEVIQVTVNVPE